MCQSKITKSVKMVASAQKYDPPTRAARTVLMEPNVGDEYFSRGRALAGFDAALKAARPGPSGEGKRATPVSPQ